MKKKNLVTMAAIMLALLFTLVACTAQPAPPVASPTPATDAAKVQGGSAGQVELTDLKGNKITLEMLPQRIVSLSPANTELVFELGAGDKLVGVTSYCDYPEAAKKIEKIGTFEGPNLELIQKLQPDVVLAGGYIQEDLIKKLQELKIPVVSTEATDFNGIYDSIRLLAKVTDTEPKGEELIAGMQKSIDEIKAKTKDKPKKKVFYVVWSDPITTAGSGTFINDLIKIAGGINTAEKAEGWAKYSAEALMGDNPDILISAHFATTDGITKDYFSKTPVFKNLDCVKKGNVFIVSDDNIVSRSTPRIIQGLEEITKIIQGQ